MHDVKPSLFTFSGLRVDAASDKLRLLFSQDRHSHVHYPSPDMLIFYEVMLGIALFVFIAYAIYLKLQQRRLKKLEPKKLVRLRNKRRPKRRKRQ